MGGEEPKSSDFWCSILAPPEHLTETLGLLSVVYLVLRVQAVFFLVFVFVFVLFRIATISQKNVAGYIIVENEARMATFNYLCGEFIGREPFELTFFVEPHVYCIVYGNKLDVAADVVLKFFEGEMLSIFGEYGIYSSVCFDVLCHSVSELV